MSTGAKFLLQDFYQALMSSNLKQKLRPFILQFKKKNISFIYDTLVNILQILNGKQQKPICKFNALLAVKLFFDTGEYIAITLIQVYILPVIIQVALYRAHKRSQQGLTLYFIQKGYEATKEMKRIGFNFALLAIQFIFLAAEVKPFRTIQIYQLKESSNFARAAKYIKEKGVPEIKTYKFYIPSYGVMTRKRFQRKLSRFFPEQYTQYFLKMITEELSLNRKNQIDLKKLLFYGDAFLTVPLMNVCQQQLGNMQNNFPSKKRFLSMLGQFVRMGDIYAIFIITRSNFLQSIAEQVQKVNGNKGLDAGQCIYPSAQASKPDKREFYNQFLKYLQIWAYSYPNDQQGQPTQAKIIYQRLKTQRKFVFTVNILLAKLKQQMDNNIKQNQQRNQKLLKLLDDQTQRNSQTQDLTSKLQSYLEYDDVRQRVNQAQRLLDVINQKKHLQKHIVVLNQFKRFWQNNIGKNQIDADQDQNVQQLVQEGDLCIKILQIVNLVFQLYKNGSINFEQYKDRVDLLIKKEAEGEGSAGKEVSFDDGLKTSSIVQSSSFAIQPSLRIESNGKNSFISNRKNAEKAKEGSEVKSRQRSIKGSKLDKDDSQVNSREGSFYKPNRINNDYQQNQRQGSFNKSKRGKQDYHSSERQGSYYKSKRVNEDYQYGEREGLYQKPKNRREPSQSGSRQGSYKLKQVKESSYVGSRQGSKINSRVSKQSSRKSERSQQMSKQQSINEISDYCLVQNPIHKSAKPLKNQPRAIKKKSQNVSFRDSFAESSRQHQNESKKSSQVFSKPSQYLDSSDYRQGSSDQPYNQKSKVSRRDDNSGFRHSESSVSNNSSRGMRDSRRLTRRQQQSSQNQKSANKKYMKESALSKDSTTSMKFMNNLRQVQRSPWRQKTQKQSFISSNTPQTEPRVIQIQVDGRQKQAQKAKLKSFYDTNTMQYFGSPQKNNPISEYRSQPFNVDQPSIQGHLPTQTNKNSRAIQTPKIQQKSSKQVLTPVSQPFLYNKQSKPSLQPDQIYTPKIFTKYQQEQSLIQIPQYDPLLQSYHLQPQYSKSINNTNGSSFKSCFQVKHQIILAKQNKQKIFNVQNGRIMNFIGSALPKHAPRTCSIMDMLSQRNAKHSIQNYCNQMQEIRIAHTMSQKARSLQSFNKNMRMKFLVKKKDKDKSKLKEKALAGGKNSQFGVFSRQDFMQSQFSQAVKIDQGPRLINNAIYTHYFPQNKNERTKKSMLKNKGLVQRTQQFQIGYICNRNQKNLQITLYLTPLKKSIYEVQLSLLNDNNLHVKLSHTKIKAIKGGQQENINMLCQVQSVPFVLPTLSVRFKKNEAYQNNHLLITVPCSFNKFFKIHGMVEDTLQHLQKKDELITTQAFRPSHRLTNPQKIQQSLKPMILFNSRDGDASYGAQAYFKGKIFLLICRIRDGRMAFEGRNMTGDHKNTKYLQFLLTTLREIFETLKAG